MVLIDTSVWISLYRKKDLPIGQLVWSLVAKNEAALCGQVLVEFLGGFGKKHERSNFEAQLSHFPFIETSREAYLLAAHLLACHPCLGSGDVIIAATAITADCPLLTLDKDFEQVAAEGLVIIRHG